MKLGIVGLPNSGKSTLFNAIMHTGAEASNYPFSTVSPNVGQVPVPDERITRLVEMYDPKKTTPATVEMVDIAGLVKGASSGEGLGNQFLSHIREVDAIIHVVRCFEDENVVSVYDTIDPVRDIETVNLELVLSDLELVERRLEKLQKAVRTDKSLKWQEDVLIKIKEVLEEGQSASSINWPTAEEQKFAESLTLITKKPVLLAANISEGDIKDPSNNPSLEALHGYAEKLGSRLFISCAKLEAEIATLDHEEKEMFMEELGLSENGIARLISAGYDLLGLISFFTTGPKEVRAWTIQSGTKASAAAGKIHSDLERGFIRAEVVAYNDLMSSGSYNGAKEKGLVRIEGRDYVIFDGDVILVRFNV